LHQAEGSILNSPNTSYNRGVGQKEEIKVNEDEQNGIVGMES